MLPSKKNYYFWFHNSFPIITAVKGRLNSQFHTYTRIVYCLKTLPCSSFAEQHLQHCILTSVFRYRIFSHQHSSFLPDISHFNSYSAGDLLIVNVTFPSLISLSDAGNKKFRYYICVTSGLISFLFFSVVTKMNAYNSATECPVNFWLSILLV